MRTNWRKTVGALCAFVGLMTLGGSLEAEHAPVQGTPMPVLELLHSSGLRSGIRSTTDAAEACVVNPAKELFITDVSVVDDCYRTTWTGSCPGTLTPATRGAWTFGRIAEGIFGTTDSKTLSKRVRDWLRLWTKDQVVNGEEVPARDAMRDLVLKPWEKASKGGHLDMKKAPFRLQAFILRTDIGIPSSQHLDKAGEFRLIYNVLDENGQPTPFTIIFEYEIPTHSCEETLDFIHGFHALSSLEFGPQYNAALQALTDRIITLGAAPSRLNGSTLLAVRTNETFLDTPWELRSFMLAPPDDDDDDEDDDEDLVHGSSHDQHLARLVHQPLAETPAIRYQGTQTLADFLIEFTPQILAQTLRLPLTYRGEPLLAGVAHNDLSLGWAGPAPICTSAPRVPRRLFSINTCQGCHGKETGTNFVHVAPRQAGQPSALSRLVQGPFFTVRDDCNTVLAPFDMPRRVAFHCFLLSQSCSP